MEAEVILAKCPKNNRTYGMRTQKMSDGDWWRTWAFPINEKKAHNEGYDITEVKGGLNPMEEYPGCPYCGTKGFVQCGRCRKLSCYNGEEQIVCKWCGNLMSNFVTSESFDVSGGGI